MDQKNRSSRDFEIRGTELSLIMIIDDRSLLLFSGEEMKANVCFQDKNRTKGISKKQLHVY